MKETLFIITGIFIIIFCSPAQNSSGFQFGINFSGLSGNLGYKSGDVNNPFEMSRYIRITLGWDENYDWKEHIQFSPELNLSFQGAKFEAAAPNEIREYYLTYLNLPLVFNIGVFDEPLSYYGIFGPFAGFLVGGTGKVYGTGYTSVITDNIKKFFELESIQQPHRDIDAGIVLGAGAGLQLGQGQLFGELRFHRGFINVASDDVVSRYFKNIGANSVIQLILGYRLGFSALFQ